VFTTETQSTQSFYFYTFPPSRPQRLCGESSEPFVSFVIFVVSKCVVK